MIFTFPFNLTNESENNFSEQKLTKFYMFQKLYPFIFHVNVKHEIILTLFYFFHHHLSVFILKWEARTRLPLGIYSSSNPIYSFYQECLHPPHNIIISKRSEKLKYFKNYLYIIFHPIVRHYITVNKPLPLNKPYFIPSITLLSSLKRFYFTLFLLPLRKYFPKNFQKRSFISLSSPKKEIWLNIFINCHPLSLSRKS